MNLHYETVSPLLKEILQKNIERTDWQGFHPCRRNLPEFTARAPEIY